ncbi:MAG TPA: hypothetical protein VF618_00825 [Thermoanaerobaculia bacterium]
MHVQQFLARLYTDGALLERFVAEPYATAREEGFDEEAAREFAAMDAESLKLAARSFAGKRAGRGDHR